MKKTILLTMLLAAALVWAQDTAAAEEPVTETKFEVNASRPVPKVYVTGDVDADMAVGFGQAGSGFGYALDVNFTFGVSLGKASAELYLTVTTGDAGDLPAGGSTGGKWWPYAAFDGAAIMVADIGGFLSLDVFDYVTDIGSVSYYWLKNYPLAAPTMYPRGLQAHVAIGEGNEVVVGAGIDDGDTYLFSGSVSVKDGLFSLGAAASYNTGSYNFVTLGAALAVHELLNVVVGTVMPVSGKKFAIHGGVEGSLGISDSLSLAYSVFGGTDSTSRTDVFGDRFVETLLVYAEPGYSFSEEFTIGLPLEYHLFGSTINGESSSEVWVVPTLYFYPAEGMEIWLWGQSVFGIGDSEPSLFAGTEIIFSF
jgi:hypothetical protein